jgi:hypothetical protein
VMMPPWPQARLTLPAVVGRRLNEGLGVAGGVALGPRQV